MSEPHRSSQWEGERTAYTRDDRRRDGPYNYSNEYGRDRERSSYNDQSRRDYPHPPRDYDSRDSRGYRERRDYSPQRRDVGRYTKPLSEAQRAEREKEQKEREERLSNFWGPSDIEDGILTDSEDEKQQKSTKKSTSESHDYSSESSEDEKDRHRSSRHRSSRSSKKSRRHASSDSSSSESDTDSESSDDDRRRRRDRKGSSRYSSSSHRRDHSREREKDRDREKTRDREREREREREKRRSRSRDKDRDRRRDRDRHDRRRDRDDEDRHRDRDRSRDGRRDRDSDRDRDRDSHRRSEDEDKPRAQCEVKAEDVKRESTLDAIAPASTTLTTSDGKNDNVAEESDDEYGPAPARSMNTDANSKIHYGSGLLHGEGDALAGYVKSGVRIPRRGEIGLTPTEIQHFENTGFVMSGSRHARMNAVRIRKENQVYSAEEQRALAALNLEEKMKREQKVMMDLRKLLQDEDDGEQR